VPTSTLELPVPGPRSHEKYDHLIATARALPKLKVAVAHPCDEAALVAVLEAAELGIIEPILVGAQAKVEAAAAALGADISSFRLCEAAHSHEAAERAVALTRTGEAEALMKGSLHTDELMAAVVRREGGLRTARRLSHCYVMDVPSHPTPLIVTDAAVNIAPSLDEKRDITQNAIDLARALGVETVRVAILSAMETVNPKLISTLDAAALCKMADRGQITGAVLDGPLALDNAINLGAAQIKKIHSPVAGRANVLVVPDLVAGNILAKSLTFLAGADAAGIVLGARVPIILTSRADARLTRLASCAVASLVAVAERARRVLGLGDDLRPQRRLIEPQGPGLRNRRDRGAARAGILGSVSWAARPGRSPLSTGLPTCRAVPRAAARLPPCRPDHPYGRGTDDRAQRARRTAPDPASTDLTSNGSPRWKR
jgi:phosphate acetyltransferase